MHSFEANIRIWQPENSDVHWGEAEVNITFEGRLILMLIEKEYTYCFAIWHFLYIPSFILSISIFINLLNLYVSSALKTHLFQLIISEIPETLN